MHSRNRYIARPAVIRRCYRRLFQSNILFASSLRRVLLDHHDVLVARERIGVQGTPAPDLGDMAGTPACAAVKPFVEHGAGGAGSGGLPSGITFGRVPPLPVTLRLIHPPPPKMTQG